MKSPDILLDVPLFHQEEGSTNCQAVCTQMLLHYYGDEVSIDKVMAGLEPYFIEGKGMHSEGPAMYLAGLGYDVTFHSSDPNVLGTSVGEVTEGDRDTIKRYLENVKTKDWPDYGIEKLELALQVIDAGCKFRNTIPEFDLIDEALEAKIPVKIGVGAAALHGWPRSHGGHSIIVIGKAGDDYVINDPNPAFPEAYVLKRNRLALAWYSQGARALLVHKS